MEVKVNIKANKLTDEQQRVLVDALTDYVGEEGDMNIAQNLAVRVKKGVVMLFEYEPQLTPCTSLVGINEARAHYLKEIKDEQED